MKFNKFNPNPVGASRRHDGLKPLHRTPGAYLLRVGKNYYVGSSKDLRSRLRSWAARLSGHEYVAIPCQEYRVMEQHLLDRLKARKLSVMNVHRAVREKRLPRPKAQRPCLYPKPRHHRYTTIDGVTKPFSHWCKEAGISIECALMRIRLGWTERRALTTPLQKIFKKRS